MRESYSGVVVGVWCRMLIPGVTTLPPPPPPEQQVSSFTWFHHNHLAPARPAPPRPAHTATTHLTHLGFSLYLSCLLTQVALRYRPWPDGHRR